jgi:NAD(P)-dependent dehydrogenase (short-subunit alcohol dehydrogenase family)
MSSPEEQPFAGKVAIVTGGSRGIGRAVANDLVRSGASVCLTGRKQEALDATVEELGADCALGLVGRADDSAHQEEVVHTVVERFGRVDYLVNNAGINPIYGPLVDLDLRTARKMVEVNTLAPLAWTQRVYHGWMREHGGSVVNIASIAALRHAEGVGLYGASKAMLAHLTAQLAFELGPNVRVNAVAPAVVKTAFASALYEGKEADVARHYPLRRLGSPDDVSRAILFLLSDNASWITGQVTVIDGGITLGLAE